MEENSGDKMHWFFNLLNGIILILVGTYLFFEFQAFEELNPSDPYARKGYAFLKLFEIVGGKWAVLLVFGVIGSLELLNFYNKKSKKKSN